MRIHWDSTTIAIATSVTALATVGALFMKSLLDKPNAVLLDVSPVGWFFLYKGGTEIDGARITLKVRIQNSGSEPTTITGCFKASNGKTFNIERAIALGGHGAILEDIISLDLPLESGIPETGKSLHGILQLEPWRNRMLFMGQKYLTAELDIPENQTVRML